MKADPGLVEEALTEASEEIVDCPVWTGELSEAECDGCLYEKVCEWIKERIEAWEE